MSLKGKLRFVGQTDTGKVREHNEDTIAYDPDIGLLVLADGMGGYNAGEVASGIAVKTIVNLVREQVEREDLRDPRSRAGPVPRHHHPARRHPAAPTRSSTRPPAPSRSARAWARRWSARCSSTTGSPSRTSATRACTAMRSDKFEQVTMDHSLLQELVDRGFYSAEEAQRAANKNYVTRALGVEPQRRRRDPGSTRCRRVTCISFARTASRTWSRTTIFT